MMLAGQPPVNCADLYDDHHAVLQVCDLQFRSFGQWNSFCGPCETVSTFEDHIPVLQMLETPGDGRVLVVQAGGSTKVGVMGDRLAGLAVQNGWRGVVINGAIRDSAGIIALPLGVKALGTTARRGWSLADTTKGQNVMFGGVIFIPGNWVYADQDSVLSGPSHRLIHEQS